MSGARAQPDYMLKDEMPPLSVWLGFLAMVIGNFMALLDVQIVASSIGAIQAGVSASRDEVSWVQTSYLIAEVIGIPLCGFLGRTLGTRLLFCLSAATFSVASALCAFAWDINSLIVFRAMQGFFGAAMIPTTMATLYLVMPPRYQGMAAVMLGVFSTFASSMGPTIGGFISESMGWRALFWLNLAPGIVCTILVWRMLKGGDGQMSLLRRIDVSGLIGLAVFLGAAQYLLEEGASQGWFASSELVWCGLASLVGGLIFFYRAFSADVPIVDLRPFQTPSFAIGAVLAFILGIGLFSSIFLLPLYLSSVRGYNALQIGHAMFVQGAVMFVIGPIMGYFVRSISDLRPFAVAGFLLLGLSCWMQTGVTGEWGLEQLAWPQAVRAIGLTFAFSSIMQPALSSLPPDLVHSGSGLFNTIRNMGGAFGIAGLSTMQKYDLEFHRQQLYSALDPNNPHVMQMLQGMQAHLQQNGAAYPERQALMYYASILDREALVMTFDNLFLILAVVLTVSSFAVLFMQPPRSRKLESIATEIAAH